MIGRYCDGFKIFSFEAHAVVYQTLKERLDTLHGTVAELRARGEDDREGVAWGRELEHIVLVAQDVSSSFISSHALPS